MFGARGGNISMADALARSRRWSGGLAFRRGHDFLPHDGAWHVSWGPPYGSNNEHGSKRNTAHDDMLLLLLIGQLPD